MKETWQVKGVGVYAQCASVGVDGFWFTVFRLFGSDSGHLDVVIDAKGNKILHNSELYNKCVDEFKKN